MVVGWTIESSFSSITPSSSEWNTLSNATRIHCVAFEPAAASALESSGLMIMIVHFRDSLVYQLGFALPAESTSTFPRPQACSSASADEVYRALRSDIFGVVHSLHQCSLSIPQFIFRIHPRLPLHFRLVRSTRFVVVAETRFDIVGGNCR
ncbi:hypothetical protein C8J56DRAFT_52687 [Mycena floridula]|nr:hypothetical protein C8J56DRAFT_52687 [Mycena floridula]